jgi:sulfoxide reductase heme-binding subunit YedZ
MSGFYFWLMGYRLMARYGYKDGLAPLLSLSIAAAILTVSGEAAWYELMTGVGGARVLSANLGADFGIRPAWWVLAAGLAATAISEARRRVRPARGRARHATA